MRRIGVVALAAIATIGATGASVAQEATGGEGRFMVRGRVLYMVTANESSSIPALGVPRDEIHVSQKVFPEIDFS